MGPFDGPLIWFWNPSAAPPCATQTPIEFEKIEGALLH